MAVHAGKDGYFKMKLSSATGAADKVAYIDNYSLNINASVAEVSQLGDEWKKTVATLKDWSGNASGTLDLADAEQAMILGMFTESSKVAAVDIVFGLGGTSEYGGKATISGITIGASVNDKVTFSFNFSGDGPLTLTNAETT